MKSLFALVVVLLLVPVASAHATITRGWAVAGPMIQPRTGAEAVLLDDGRVLVAGGFGFVPGQLSSAELFNPNSGTWSAAASMREPRAGFALTKLSDGRVLAVGGNTSYPNTSEVYDPARDLWTPVGAFNKGRNNVLLIALPNGRAVAIGGDEGTTEVFEPRTSSWSTLLTPFPGTGTRWLHAGAAASLPDGRVVYSGGVRPESGSYLYFSDTTVFDGATWKPFPSMLHRRMTHALIPLPGGRLLAAGGYGNEGFVWPSEVYEPNVNAWQQAGPMLSNRNGAVVTGLANGSAMVIGGSSTDLKPLTGTEQFVPSTRTWAPGEPMLGPHVSHTATLLHDGRVLVAGGRPDLNSGGTFSSPTEIWTPTTAFTADAAVALGDHVLATTATAGATVTNRGDQPLITDGYTITGPDAGDFAADSGACRTVAPGASCTIPVRFTPSVAGARAATLTFATNAAAAAPVIALSGTGVTPPLPLGAGPDADGDGVPDAQDRCPATRGGAARTGCPTGLLADPSIRYQRLKRGIKVIAYYVKATTGARITVSCTKQACKRAVAKGKGSKPVRIKTLNGKRLGNGTRITITVSMPGRLTTTVTDRVAKSRRTEGRPRCSPVGC